MTFHITMGALRQEKHSFPVFSLSPPFFHSFSSASDGTHSSRVSWLSQLLFHPSRCCLFLAGSSSGAMVQVRNKQGKELALFANSEAEEKVQVGVSKQKEFCGRRKESISWGYCSRDILAVHPQLLKGFSSPSPVPAPGELPGFAGESPIPAEFTNSSASQNSAGFIT